jgi:glucokinase
MNLIGINIGGTRCSVVSSNLNADILGVRTFPTGKLPETIGKLKSAIAEFNPGRNTVFGISCGGPLDCEKGLILSPPNLPGWDRVPICAIVTKKFGGKAYLMNDADASALAEWRFGAGKGYKNLVFLTFGTGMGAGLIIDGKLYEGSSGMAGEVGHIRLSPGGPAGYGKKGSFEGFCSGGGIAQGAVKRTKNLKTALAVALAAKRGNPAAKKILKESGEKLGEALAIIIDILNPQVIVIGSIYARCRKFLEPSMRKTLAKEALPRSLRACKIVPAKLGEEIGSYAAISVALYRGRH